MVAEGSERAVSKDGTISVFPLIWFQDGSETVRPVHMRCPTYRHPGLICDEYFFLPCLQHINGNIK